jgi:cysteine desulfurase
MRAYFDYNASSLPYPEVIDAMTRTSREGAGNPSSMHGEGRRARRSIEDARDRVAALLGTSSRRVVFTSGATEANNTALRGFAVSSQSGAIVTTTIEHHSILATVTALEASGARVVRVGVDRFGHPDLEAIGRASKEGPTLLSIAAANGESGHVVDLDAVRAVLAPGARLHVDAAQAVGRIPVIVEKRIDLLSLSAHKFGGPTGVGALVIPDDLRWQSLLTGGPQERSIRAGTENVAGIVGLGVAAEISAARMRDEAERCRRLREGLWQSLSTRTDGLLRISPDDGLPNTLTVAVDRLGSDVIVAGLDLAGFAVSTGSACAAGAPEPSHVMKALGIDERYAAGVVRISMGHATTEAAVAGLADAFVEVVGRARKAA